MYSAFAGKAASLSQHQEALEREIQFHWTGLKHNLSPGSIFKATFNSGFQRLKGETLDVVSILKSGFGLGAGLLSKRFTAGLLKKWPVFLKNSHCIFSATGCLYLAVKKELMEIHKKWWMVALRSTNENLSIAKILPETTPGSELSDCCKKWFIE